jgi:predicted Zn-dependent protease
LASTFWDTGQTAKAEQVLQNGLDRTPKNALLYKGYGTMLLKLAGADSAVKARAVEMLKKAVALNPALSEPHFQLGNLALANDDYVTAARELETAARLNRASSKIHYALARLYMREGETAKAARERQLFEQLKTREDNPLADAPASPSSLKPTG